MVGLGSVAVGDLLVAPNGGLLRSSDELMGVERASDDLIDAVRRRRDLRTSNDIERMLDLQGAEAAMFEGTDLILHRMNPSKAALLEEFLHGTQSKAGIIKRLGRQGAEVHVKEFMIRHRRLLGLSDEDVGILRQLLEIECRKLLGGN